MKKLLLVIISTLMITTTSITAFAAPSSNQSTQFNLVDHGDWPLPSADSRSISREEAAQIGVYALEQFFNADISGSTVFMHYNERIESRTGEIGGMRYEQIEIPSQWSGFIMPGGSDNIYKYWFSEFDFIINAETGELMAARFTPGTTEATTMTTPSYRVTDHSDFFGFEPTAQHNINFSRLSMDIAQEFNLFEREVARARLVALMHGASPMGQPILQFMVEIQSVDGETMLLRFDGENQPVLTSVENDFSLWAWRGSSRFDWVTR